MKDPSCEARHHAQSHFRTLFFPHPVHRGCGYIDWACSCCGEQQDAAGLRIAWFSPELQRNVC